MKTEEILSILNRGTSLPCGEQCDCIDLKTNVIGICRDEITENGKYCMYRCIQLAIKKIQEG